MQDDVKLQLQAQTDPVLELCDRAQQTQALVKFRDFHEAHPEVFGELLTEVRLWMQNGRRALSMVSLIHYLRWSLVWEKKAGEPYKLNDHTAAMYSRVLVILFPEFNGCFEFRRPETNAVLRVRLEDRKHPGFYKRRLVWADGTPLDDGWRPAMPYASSRKAKRRPHLHSSSDWCCQHCGKSNRA